MPFYEYQCAACGHHHEALQKVTDRVLRKCPACLRPSLKRLVSAPVFRLKGGGWYETDFKHDKEAKRNIAGEKEQASADADKPKDAKDDKAQAKPAEKKPDAAPAVKPAATAAAKKPSPARRRRARRRAPRR